MTVSKSGVVDSPSSTSPGRSDVSRSEASGLWLTKELL